MSERQPTEPDAQPNTERDAEWRRRRRRAEIFGDVLPETTNDERDPARPDREPAGERWLREQVPPHHGS